MSVKAKVWKKILQTAPGPTGVTIDRALRSERATMSTGGSSGSPRVDAKMVEDAQRALVAFSGVPATAVSGEAGAETEVRASAATNP